MPSKPVKSAPYLSARITFGHALRTARKAQGMTQEALAHEAGMDRAYVADIERGDRNVAIDNLEKLAAAVSLPLWKMLEPIEAD